MNFPPPFEARTPDGKRVVVDDVDVLLGLAAAYAGVTPANLDRRKLDAALASIGAPALHAERATMVYAGRKRQAHLARVQRGAQRIRALGVVVVMALVFVVYGSRLEKRLGAKLERAHVAEGVFRRERARADEAMRRLEAAGLDAAERESLEIGLDAAEDRVSAARRRYDALANDYVAAVRGFPTSPFARYVGLPQTIPMSWELRRAR